MVKNKKALILLLVFLAFFNSPAYPKNKSIKYLPSSQDIETVSKDYSSSPIVLGEIDCSTCAGLFNLSYACNNCVKLKEACPDDCLTTNPPDTQKVIKCTEGDESADYNCTEAPFRVAGCPQVECGAGTTGTGGSRSSDKSTDCEDLTCSSGSVLSGSPYGLQRRGCPDADSDELAPAGCSGCIVSGTGKDRVWTCPKTSSCTSASSPSFQTCSEAFGPPRCDNLSSYYDVTCAPVSCAYSLNSTFKLCIDTCATYADDYEECQDRVECCTRELCGTKSTGDCCTSPESRCKERSTVSPACYNSTEGRCTKLNQKAQECLEGAEGTCFRKIDSNTYYDFTARTGEAYNVIWQINTEPLVEAKNDENAKFYTMIKVVNSSDMTVYSSRLHQKSLNATFSIYGKALIPKGTLKPGKYHKIQVYYFMNDNVDNASTSENEGTDYKVKIKHMSLTVIRVRE